MTQTSSLPSSRSTPHFFVERSGFVLLMLLAISSAVPFLVRSMTGFAMMVMACMVYAFLPIRLPKNTVLLQAFVLNVVFVVLGLVIVALSFMGFFDLFPLWPLKKSYIIRQSYMIFLWLPLGYACLCFWVWNIGSFSRFFGKYGLIACAAILFVDLLTSKIFGDVRTDEWVGYVFYLDKLLLGFLFVFIAGCHVVANPRSLAFPALMLAGFGLSHALRLGILFNAQTGTILLVVLMLAWIPVVHMLQRARIIVALICALHIILSVGLFYPKPFEDDGNTIWRLNAWRNNWEMLWQSDLLGMGFGTPYHAQSAENLRNTALNESSLLQNGPTALSEPQYYRGQHSSFVNIFYRMGLLGGVLFVLINAFGLASCMRGIRFSQSDYEQNVCFVAFLLLTVQILQMSLHVGLETPRFLVVYLLSLTLAFLAPFVVRIADLRGVKPSLLAL